MTVDEVGGVYIGGTTLGDMVGPCVGVADTFVSKFDGMGNPLWTRQYGGRTGDYGEAVAADATGVYLTGETYGSLAGPYLGQEDAFLVKYDPAGNLLWSRQIATTGADFGLALAPDGVGGVYISGRTSGYFEGGPTGGYVAFLGRYDESGNQLWIHRIGDAVGTYCASVAVDGAGGVYISGHTLAALGGPRAGEFDVYLAKYDDSGNPLWIRQIGTPTQDYCYGVAADKAGGIYVTGWTSGELGGPSAGVYDAFLIKYDDSGNLQWCEQIGSSWSDYSYSVAADGADIVYISGTSDGSLGGPNPVHHGAFLVSYVVPEPATLALLAAGAGGAVLGLRRNRARRR